MPITTEAVEPVARKWVERAIRGRAHRNMHLYLRLLVASLVDDARLCATLVEGELDPRFAVLSEGDRALVDLLGEWRDWARHPCGQRRLSQPDWPTGIVQQWPSGGPRTRYDIIGD